MIRPVALTFRLFGNIYGGEQTMEKLMDAGAQVLAFLPALPFYFMELLVGFVQALVFMLLCAVFLSSSANTRRGRASLTLSGGLTMA